MLAQWCAFVVFGLLCLGCPVHGQTVDGELNPTIIRNSTQCLQQLALMLNGQAAYSGEVGPLMLMSYGKGFGDLGDYETCEQLGSGTARYAWVTTIRDAGMNAALGLCVPALCDEGSLPGSIAFLLDRLFNTTVPTPSDNWDIHFASDVPLDTGGVLTVIAFFLLCLPVVLATGANVVHSRWTNLFSNQVGGDEAERIMLDDPAQDPEDRRAAFVGADAYAQRAAQSKPQPAPWVMVWSAVGSLKALLSNSREPHLTPGFTDPAGPMAASLGLPESHSHALSRGAAVSSHAAGGGVGSAVPSTPKSKTTSATAAGGGMASGGGGGTGLSLGLGSPDHAGGGSLLLAHSQHGAHTQQSGAQGAAGDAAEVGSGWVGVRISELASLNGLRVIALLWIILGHTFELLRDLIKNETFVERFVARRFSFQIITSSGLGADMLLLSGGFLAAFVMYAILEKEGRLRLSFIYLHRLLRFWPTLVFCLFVWYFVAPTFANGPLWFALRRSIASDCAKYWWTNLLFINNLYNAQPQSLCVGWSWYLSLDVQLFLLSPLFVWCYYRSPRLGSTLLALGICGTLTANAALAYTHDVSPNPVNGGSRFDTYRSLFITKPWTRAAPYLVGIATYFLFRSLKTAATARLRARRTVSGSLGPSGSLLDSRDGRGILTVDSHYAAHASGGGLRQRGNGAGLGLGGPGAHGAGMGHNGGLGLGAGGMGGGRDGGGVEESSSWSDGYGYQYDSGYAGYDGGYGGGPGVDALLARQAEWDLDWQVAGFEVPFALVQIVAYAVSITLLGLTIFGPYSDYNAPRKTLTEPVWSDTQNLMFITFGRFAFSVGLAILLLLTLLSPGGWVNMFLSAWVWHVLSKLVYTAFLISPMVICVYYSSTGALIYYQDLTLVYVYITNVFLSFVFGLLVYLIVERPFKNLERLLWTKLLAEQ